MPRVSIIVPIYNVEEYLERNLTSLKEQTFEDIEVLCVNDGSTDKSQDIIDRFVAMDSRFHSYIKENGGLSDARNFGLQYVKSEYVMFIDSDDFSEKEMVETCVKAMDKEYLDMFVFGYNQYYLENGTKEKIDLGIEDGVYTLKDAPSLLAKTPNAAWNKMYRTSLFLENDIRYPFGYRHQDLGTTAKLLYLSSKIGYSNKALYNYLIDRPNNITGKVDNKIYHIIDMCQEILDYYKEKGVFDLYYDELNYLVEQNLLYSLYKSMRLSDGAFVIKFIDDVFAFKRKYFYRKNRRYTIANTRSDKIYLNKALCKLYYKYQRNK